MLWLQVLECVGGAGHSDGVDGARHACRGCRCWDVLVELIPIEGLAVIEEVAAAMRRPGGVRNVPGFFQVCHATTQCSLVRV